MTGVPWPAQWQPLAARCRLRASDLAPAATVGMPTLLRGVAHHNRTNSSCDRERLVQCVRSLRRSTLLPCVRRRLCGEVMVPTMIVLQPLVVRVVVQSGDGTFSRFFAIMLAAPILATDCRSDAAVLLLTGRPPKLSTALSVRWQQL